MLLALTMLVGMIPATTLTANAETGIGIATWEELEAALTSGTDGSYYMLTEDIEHSHKPDSNGHSTTYIRRNITLDLNGHKIVCKDESNKGGTWGKCDSDSRTLFHVANSDFTLNDSVGGGKISFTAAHTSYDVRFEGYAYRNIFSVGWDSTLIINGGEIAAGSTYKHYMSDGFHCSRDWTSVFQNYNGNVIQQAHGSAVTVEAGGKLVVNGGELSGRGMSAWRESTTYALDEAIEIKKGASVVINGGAVIGKGGADVFDGGGLDDGLTIRGGTFKTDKHDNFQVAGNSDMGIGTHGIAASGRYGSLNIPKSAYRSEYDRMQIIGNDMILNGTDIVGYDFLETAGEKMDITFVPWLNDENKLLGTLNGGPYTNETVHYDGREFNWNTKSEDLTATVKYTPYFADSTGISDYKITYTWGITGTTTGGSKKSATVTTTTGSLNVSQAWEDKTGLTDFKDLSVMCMVTETGSNLKYNLQTWTNRFVLNSTKTPLDETSLPGGEMEVKISYPEYSGLHSDIVVTVNPSPEELAKAENGSCTVRYEYLYRDNMAEWEDTPFVWSKNTHGFGDLDWGHVKVDVKMIVFGTNGAGYVFEKSAWALKLPDITVSGATLNSDKTAYVGNPGTPVTLKAPIDVTNADIAADKIVASDIAGLYRITYDNSGNPVMSLVTAGSYTQYQVTGNGTYCYAAYDRDGGLVYSKPVKVEFNAEAYGISITKSNNDIFTVYNNGSVVMPLTITATYGSSVSPGNIRWAIQSYPQGMSTSDFTYVNAHGKSAISFQKLFKDVKTIVPGNYVVMAYVVKDGQYLTASNAVTVQVARIADFVDITDEAGNVISGKTMEGPYVGNTMKLNCVPGNGASAPSFKSVTWKIESLVGTDVATISGSGVLTIKNPGQIKVTATATVGVGQTALANNTQSVIINIPITEVEVTLGTPTIGGDPSKIASVPADAPYELVYDPKYSWASGVSTKGEFLGNSIPELSVEIAPKDGYVFPARQLYLGDYDKSWYTYADDMVVKVNGTAYNFRDFETTYTDGSSQYNGDYGTWYEAQSIDFYWKWERLIDPTHTYLNYVNLTVPIPAVGDNGDLAPDDEYAWALPECSNTDAIYSWVNDNGIYKVSGDYLNDNDSSNDNAVKMTDGETYQRGQMYRANIYFSTTNKNYTTYFGKNVTLMINGTPCQLIDLYYSTDVEGKTNGIACYYFMPTAPIQTIEDLIIVDLEAPVGYKKPATADDITEFLSNFAVGDEVYVTRLTWFLDSNNNSVLDSGEDSTEFFNADGSFIAGLRYSVHLELEARDRDDDGKGDFVKFADNAKIYLSSQSNAQMTGNQNGAVYKFPVATVPAKAVTADPASVTIHLAEGYSGRPITYINLTSVGTTTVTSVVATEGDTDLIYVSCDGMTVAVIPDGGLTAGLYNTVVYIQDEYGSVYTTIPVTINVGAAPVGVTVSGTVTSFNSNTDEITVALYKESSASADYTATVKGNSASYTLSGVAAGTYTMKVSKNNHVTREYELTVGTGNVTQDVKIHLKGDINGDGRVNTTDVGRANAHAKKTNLLSGYELSCADVSGDGKVNTTDVGRMNAHAKKTNLMW